MSSPGSGRVPWSKAITTGPTSSSAPGPPSSHLLKPQPTTKKSTPKASMSLSGGKTNGAREDGNKNSFEKDSLEGWDPMKFDYASKDFNSYRDGPGQRLEARDQKDVVTLFVDNIPAKLTKEGLRNLFSELVGTVKRATVIPAVSGKPTTYGFVEFNTVRESELAIQRLHNRDIGGIKLIVKVAESKKNREDRHRKRKEQESFLNTLHCAKSGNEDDGNLSNEEAEKVNSNPLVPRYRSRSPEVTAKTSQQHTEGAASLKASPGKLAGNGNIGSASSPNGSSGSKEPKPCKVCQALTKSRCKQCGTAYCCSNCQKADWDQHKYTCRSRSSARSSRRPTTPPPFTPPAAEVLKIAENSDDEGFVLSCHGEEDLLPIKAVIEHIRSGNDPSQLEVYESPQSDPAEHKSMQNNSNPPELHKSSSNSPSVNRSSPMSKSMSLLSSTRLNSSLSSRKSSLLVGDEQASKSLPATPLSMPVSSIIPKKSLLGPFSANSTLNQTPSFPPSSLYSKVAPLSTPAFSQPAFLGPKTESRNEDLQPSITVPLSSVYSQFEEAPQPLPSLPLTATPPQEFLAIITYYHSSTQFTVVIPSVESKQALQMICECGQSFQPGKVKASYLSEGSKCGYMDSSGNFSRVYISRIFSPNSVLVQSYDLGGWHTVSPNDLCYLPEEVVLIPCLGHRCCLSNFQQSELAKEKPLEGCQSLQKLVKDKPVIVKNDHYHHTKSRVSFVMCSLQTVDGVDLSSAIQASPYVTPKRQEETSSYVPTSELRLSRQSSTVPLHMVVAGTYVDIFPTVVINPDVIWARVLHPQLFRMDQLNADLNKCYPLPDSVKPYVPVVGEICVAKYLQDQKYYRAEVLCVNYSGMVDVRFVESGITDTITTSQLYHIQPVFLTLPRQARRFCIAGVVPSQSRNWSDNSVAFLKEKILNKEIRVKILSESPSECVVDMYDPDLQNQLLSNSLVLFGHAEASDSKQLKTATPPSHFTGVTLSKKTASYERAESLQPLVEDSAVNENEPAYVSPSSKKESTAMNEGGRGKSLVSTTAPLSTSEEIPHSHLDSKDSVADVVEGETHTPPSIESPRKTLEIQPFVLSEKDCVKVCITHSATPNKFFCQVIEPGNLAKVKSTMDQLQAISPSTLLPMGKMSKRPCLCVYPEDGCVHRAKIVKYTDTEVTVVFVDYGNSYTTDHSNVYQVNPPELLALPSQAILCCLNGCLNPAGKDSNWDRAARKSFESITSLGPLVLTVVKVVGTLHVTELSVSTPEGKKDVLDLLVEKGVCAKNSKFRKGNAENERPAYNRKPKTSGTTDKPFRKKSPCEPESVGLPEEPSCVSKPNRNIFQTKKAPLPVEHTTHPLVSSLDKLSLPAPPANFSVFVCEVVSLQELYVQIANEETKTVIKSITEVLHSSLADKATPLSCAPPNGSLCCAKFSADMAWYRCEVLENKGGRFSVFFIDYGNVDFVSLSDMAACPEECTSTPIAAVKCCVGNSMSSTVKEVSFVKKFCSDKTLTAEVVGEVSGIPKLKLTDGTIDLEEEITKNCPPSPKFESKPGFSSPLVSRVKPSLLPPTCEVMIIEVVSLNELYVQVVSPEVITTLSEISYGINSSTPLQPLSSPPAVGSLCCAEFSHDETWYRVKVTQVNGDSCTVFFIDYGNNDTVSFAKLASCPSKFASLPPLAVKCALHGVPSCPEEHVVQFLREKIANKVVVARVVEVVDHVPQVEFKSDDANVLKDFSPPEAFKQESFPTVKNAKSKLPESDVFNVMVSEVVSPEEIYLQVASQEIGTMLVKISEGLTSLTSPEPLKSPPTVGSLYCAKFSQDKTWYRAEVTQVNNDSCNVFFVDYGNRDTVPLSDMAVCPSQLASIPQIAVRCGIYGAPTSPRDELTKFLKQHTVDRVLSARIQEIVNDIPQLVLESTEIDLLDEMKSLSKSKAPTFPFVRDVPLTRLPSDPFKVMVVEVVHPQEIYVHVASKDVLASLDQITNGINSLFTSSPPKPFSSSPAVSSLCCAKFSRDQSWYRAEVIQVNSNSCGVFFVDYGNKDTVLLHDMAACPEQFASLPLLAVRCGVNGFTASTKDEVIQFLKAKTSNCILSASVIQILDGVPQLELHVEGTSLATQMKSLVSTSEQSNFPVAKDLTRIELSLSVSKVVVTEIVSCEEIYVQVATEEVAEVLRKISNLDASFQLSPPQPLSSPPAVGSLCCAKFSQDNSWYRAEVTKVNKDSCTVLFVDYGNKDTVSLADMAACPEEFISLPLAAVKCSLADKLSSNIDTLREEVLNSIVSVQVSQVLEGVPQIKLASSEVNSPQQPTFPFVKNMTRLELPETSTFRVMVTEVVSPGEIYIQVASQEVATTLAKISDGIANMFETSPPKPLTSSPAVGALCCAKFSQDKSWYRAEVTQINDDMCTLFFVDYGNRDTVSLSDMTVCPQEFVSLPQVAVKCSLYDASCSTEVDIAQFLRKRTAGNVVSARTIQILDGIPVIEFLSGESSLLDEIRLSLPSVRDAGCIKLPESGVFQVVVTEVVSPEEVYVQVATPEIATTLGEISKGITSMFESSPPQPLSSPPAVGSLCCAKFSQDNTWYRAEVTRVESDKCSVVFVDYGNKDSVSLSDMTACPQKFASLPVIAVKCRVLPQDTLPTKETLSFLCDHITDTILSAKVVNSIGTPYLELIVGDTSLVELMMNKNVIMPSVQEFCLVSDIPKLSFPQPPEVFKVVISEVVSPQELYVHIVTQEVSALLGEVTDGIETIFASSPPISLTSPAPVGALCCAKFSQDSKWYRVEVLSVSDNDMSTVFFVDYGNRESVPLSSLTRCPPELKSVKALVVRCGLAGLSHPLVVSTVEVTAFLKKLQSDGLQLTAVVASSDKEGVPLLNLKQGEESIVMKLTKLGYVSKPSVPLVSSSEMQSLTFPKSSEALTAMVYEVVNLSEFYLHVRMSETASTFKKLLVGVDVYLKSSPPPLSSPPKIGGVYLSKYDDDSWCRVEVLAVKGNRCKLFYLDYGNIGAASVSGMVACPPELTSFPKAAIKCGLHGVPPDSANSKEFVSKLKHLIDNVEVSVKYVCECNGVPQVELSINGTNVIVELNMFSKDPVFPMVENMKKHEFPKSPFKVLVCELTSPQELYVQVYSEEVVKDLSTVTNGLSSFFQNKSFEPLSSPPPIGSLCCAKFSQDGKWYRAQLRGVVKNTCKVFFVDFGNSDDASLQDLAACPAELCKLPTLAVRCSLYGMQDFKLSSSDLDALKNLTTNRLLEASIVNSLDLDSPIIQLTDPSNGTLVSANFFELHRQSAENTEVLKCCVTELNNPSSFYVQHAEKDTATNLSHLNTLQNVYAEPSRYEDFHPTIGASCCAQYSEDQCWYRCKILSLTKQTATLFYVDFGSVCKVLLSKLYRLDDKFTTFPPLAVHCKLNGIKPTSGGWSKQAIEAFRDMCEGKYLGISCVKEEPDFNVVNLYSSTDKTENIAESLISNGYGIAS